MRDNTAELLPEPAIHCRKVNLNPPKDLPTSCWDPAFERPEVAKKVGLLAYSRISHLPATAGALKDPSAILTWKKKDVEMRRIAFGPPEPIEALQRAIRAVTIGEIFRKQNYGPRGQVCFHAQWMTIGFDSRGTYFVDATIGQVFGSSDSEVGVQVRLMIDDRVVGLIQWEGITHPNQNTPLRILGTDPNLPELFGSLTGAMIEFRINCTGP